MSELNFLIRAPVLTFSVGPCLALSSSAGPCADVRAVVLPAWFWGPSTIWPPVAAYGVPPPPTGALGAPAVNRAGLLTFLKHVLSVDVWLKSFGTGDAVRCRGHR